MLSTDIAYAKLALNTDHEKSDAMTNSVAFARTVRSNHRARDITDEFIAASKSKCKISRVEANTIVLPSIKTITCGSSVNK